MKASNDLRKMAEDVLKQFISSSQSELYAKTMKDLKTASENWDSMETADPEFLIDLIEQALFQVRRETAERCAEIAKNNVGTLSLSGKAGGDEITEAIHKEFLEDK